MEYFGGIAGTIAEIWFFTSKDVKYRTKVTAIIIFWIITSILLSFVSLIAYAVQVPPYLYILIALIEGMFIYMGIIWWLVAKYIKRDYQNKL